MLRRSLQTCCKVALSLFLLLLLLFSYWFAIPRKITASWAQSCTAPEYFLALLTFWWRFTSALSQNPAEKCSFPHVLEAGAHAGVWMPLAVGWTWSSKYKYRFSSDLTCSWNFDKTSICPLGQNHCSSRMTAGLLLVSLLPTPTLLFSSLHFGFHLSKGHNSDLINSLCHSFLC